MTPFQSCESKAFLATLRDSVIGYLDPGCEGSTLPSRLFGHRTSRRSLVELSLMRRWQRGLSIRDGEGRLVVWMAAVFAVTQSTHALGANSADALFFLRYGVEELPQVILVSGLAVMVALILYVAGLGRWGPRIWLPVVTGICGLWAIVEWAASFVDAPVVYPIIWISTQVVIMVTFTMMWNAAGAAANTRQAKRLFPIFASAGVAGAVIGNLLTGPLANLLGTQTLLAVQGLALLVSAGLLVVTSGLFADDPGDPGHSVREELAGAVRTVRSTRLLKLAAGVMFAFATLFFLVVFPFNSAVAASFDTEAGVAGFLGLFASIATGLTFLVSLLVTNRLFVRFGIVVTLLIVPAVYVAGSRMRWVLFPISWVISARMADVATIVEESVTGARIVKSFAGEGHEISRLARAAERLRRVALRQVRIRARYSPVMENLPMNSSRRLASSTRNTRERSLGEPW